MSETELDGELESSWESKAEEEYESARKRFESRDFADVQNILGRNEKRWQWNFNSKRRSSVLPRMLKLLIESELELMKQSSPSYLRGDKGTLFLNVRARCLFDEFPQVAGVAEVRNMFQEFQSRYGATACSSSVCLEDVSETDSSAAPSFYLISTAEPQNGVLSNYELLESVDPDKFVYESDKNETNFYLKPSAVYNLDFRLISEKELVCGCAFSIPRESDTEVQYSRFLVFGLKPGPKYVQISRRKKVQDLKRKLCHRPIRLWRFSRTSLREEWVSSLSDVKVLTYFPGARLLEDAEVISCLELEAHGHAVFAEISSEFLTSNPLDLLNTCSFCLKHTKNNQCGGCHRVVFCSKQCMQEVYMEHKAVCKRGGRSCLSFLLGASEPEWQRCFRGIKNAGMTCYMGASLQGLCSFPGLSQEILPRLADESRHSGKKHSEAVRLLLELTDLLCSIRSPGPGAVSIKPFYSAFCRIRGEFLSAGLQDAHEFLLALVDSVTEMLAGEPRTPSDRFSPEDTYWLSFLGKTCSPLSLCLYGLMESQTSCANCSYTSRNFQTFNVLSLPIPSESIFCPLKFWFFPRNAKSIIYEVTAETSMSIAELRKNLTGFLSGDLLIGYMNEKKLTLAKDDQLLHYFLLTKTRLLVYPAPADMKKVCVVHQYLHDFSNYIKLPRVIPLRQSTTLIDIYTEVYKRITPYCSEKVPINNELTLGYVLVLCHESGKVCEQCHIGASQYCELPRTTTLALTLLKQVEQSEGLQLAIIWQKGQTKVNASDVDYAEIHSGGNMTMSVDLELCLREFSKQESLDSSNQLTCEQCKKPSSATLKLTLLRTPRFLVLHLKRFACANQVSRKAINPVKFPLKGLVVNSQKGENTYDLCALVVHSGSSINGGHFYAISRRGEDWVKLDDSRVESISAMQVRREEAYLLFYECTEPQEA